MWHCAYACIEKRRHLNAKTTIVKFYICMDNCPQNKIDPPPKKIKFAQKKCPWRSCIQRLHYPAFAAFLLMKTAKEASVVHQSFLNGVAIFFG